MKSHRLMSAFLAAALLQSASARAGDVNVIRGVEVGEKDGGVELTIRGSRPPSYSVFKLQEPQRLVVDLAGADVTGISSSDVNKGGVVSFSTAQYKDARSTVGRVIVVLAGNSRYEVTPRGDDVVVHVLGAAGEPASDASPAVAAEPAPAPEVATAAPAAPGVDAARSAPETAPASEPPASATPAPGVEDHVVGVHELGQDTAAGKAARGVVGVRASSGGVLVATDGRVRKVRVLELRDPPRLALDLYGVTRAPRGSVALAGVFTGARFGQGEGRMRVVLDAAGSMPQWDVKRTAAGLLVVARPSEGDAQVATARPAAPEAPPVAPPATLPGAAATGAKAAARISTVRFSGQGAAARIEIRGKAPYTLERPDPVTVVLTLDDAQLAHSQERSLDTTAFQGPVRMVSSFNQPAARKVRIVASLRGPVEDSVRETPGGLVWTFDAKKDAAAGKGEERPVHITMNTVEAAGFAAEAPGYAAAGTPAARGFTGRRITLDFHDIDIRNLLRLIADVSKRNIVVADDVQGRVTISLRNVPWDQALDLVLRAKGLGKEETGNVMRIAKLDTIAKEQQLRAEAEKAKVPLIPLKVRIISINFSRANDIAARIKDVLSERGTVSTDERTNVLIVKDVPEAIVRAEGLARNLDVEIPQVLIEARIVEAQSNYNRALGVQWGGQGSMNQANGNPTGLIFPYNAVGTGAAGGGPTDGVSGTPNYAVNLPAAIGQGNGGGIGFTFGSIGGAFNLNLRLSALENNGIVKTISAPKIATLDNKEATIGQGTSIPFSQTSASGTNTTFVEAKLELKVTPHVSPDGTILLKIHASNNAPNPGLTGSSGQPSINKREADTEVLVKDGDTTVIGGIYTRQTASRKSGVPWLSKIPVLGYFFRTTSEQDDHTELLIFITPRILNRSATPVAGGN